MATAIAQAACVRAAAATPLGAGVHEAVKSASSALVVSALRLMDVSGVHGAPTMHLAPAAQQTASPLPAAAWVPHTLSPDTPVAPEAQQTSHVTSAAKQASNTKHMAAITTTRATGAATKCIAASSTTHTAAGGVSATQPGAINTKVLQQVLTDLPAPGSAMQHMPLDTSMLHQSSCELPATGPGAGPDRYVPLPPSASTSVAAAAAASWLGVPEPNISSSPVTLPASPTSGRYLPAPSGYGVEWPASWVWHPASTSRTNTQQQVQQHILATLHGQRGQDVLRAVRWEAQTPAQQYATTTPGSALVRYSQAIAQCATLNKLTELWMQQGSSMRSSHLAALNVRAVELQERNHHHSISTSKAMHQVQLLQLEVCKSVKVDQCTVEDLTSLLDGWCRSGFIPHRRMIEQIVHRLRPPAWAIPSASLSAPGSHTYSESHLQHIGGSDAPAPATSNCAVPRPPDCTEPDSGRGFMWASLGATDTAGWGADHPGSNSSRAALAANEAVGLSAGNAGRKLWAVQPAVDTAGGGGMAERGEPGGKLRAASFEALAVILRALRSYNAVDPPLLEALVLQVCRRGAGGKGTLHAAARLAHDLLQAGWKDAQVYGVLSLTAQQQLAISNPAATQQQLAARAGDLVWLLHSLAQAGQHDPHLLTAAADLMLQHPGMYASHPNAARVATAFALANMQHELLLNALAGAVSSSTGTMDLRSCGLLTAAYARLGCHHQPMADKVHAQAVRALSQLSQPSLSLEDNQPSATPDKPQHKFTNAIRATTIQRALDSPGARSQLFGDSKQAIAEPADATVPEQPVTNSAAGTTQRLLDSPGAVSLLVSLIQLAHCSIVESTTSIKRPGDLFNAASLAVANHVHLYLPKETCWKPLAMLLHGMAKQRVPHEASFVIAQRLASQLLSSRTASSSYQMHCWLALLQFEAQFALQRQALAAAATYPASAHPNIGSPNALPPPHRLGRPSAALQSSNSVTQWADPHQPTGTLHARCFSADAWPDVASTLRQGVSGCSHAQLCDLLWSLAMLDWVSEDSWSLVEACLGHLGSAQVQRVSFWGRGDSKGTQSSANPTQADAALALELLQLNPASLERQAPAAQAGSESQQEPLTGPSALDSARLVKLYQCFLVAEHHGLAGRFTEALRDAKLMSQAASAWQQTQRKQAQQQTFKGQLAMTGELWRVLRDMNIPLLDPRTESSLDGSPVHVATLVWLEGQLIALDIVGDHQADVNGMPLGNTLFKSRLLGWLGIKHVIITQSQWRQARDDSSAPGATARGQQAATRAGKQTAAGYTVRSTKAWPLDSASLVNKLIRDALASELAG